MWIAARSVVIVVAATAGATDRTAGQQRSALGERPVAFELTGPAFLAASVADLDASAAWYRRVLGVEAIREVTSPDGRARARILRSGDLVVELIEYEGSRSVDEAIGPDRHQLSLQGLFKIGIYVANADEVHAELRRAGVQVDAQVLFDEALDMRTFVFRDLDGNRIQVFQVCEGGCDR